MSDASVFAASRAELRRVATHVLARRRHDVTGKLGLRATPGGFGTPAFGPDVEVLRVSGTALVRERAGEVAVTAVAGSSLSALARFAEVDLTAPFDAGHDTPALGDVDAPIVIDAGHAAVVADWFALGWAALDVASAAAESPKAVQLWPEHFDAGTSVALGAGPDDRCNLGVSPGDAAHDEPYLYVGPWGADRPDDPAYWNAPFGAVVVRSAILAASDPAVAALRFFKRGLALLSRR